MRKTFLILFFVLFFFSYSVSGQLLSPVVKLEGTLDDDTLAFFAGKTSINTLVNNAANSVSRISNSHFLVTKPFGPQIFVDHH